jgi:hypothetical protein
MDSLHKFVLLGLYYDYKKFCIAAFMNAIRN